MILTRWSLHSILAKRSSFVYRKLVSWISMFDFVFDGSLRKQFVSLELIVAVLRVPFSRLNIIYMNTFKSYSFHSIHSSVQYRKFMHQDNLTYLNADNMNSCSSLNTFFFFRRVSIEFRVPTYWKSLSRVPNVSILEILSNHTDAGTI